ncbi:hypothetical protein OIV83_000543 [Microbotryomycetes sp. JL201]|nr:hypothetical protein OIV83_000543 [Microbotryomycetes sp. JL201]
MQGGSEENSSLPTPSWHRTERESSTHSSTAAAVESAHWTANHRLQDEPVTATVTSSVAPIARAHQARPSAAASRSGSASASSTTPDELDPVQSARLDSRPRTQSPASSVHDGPRPFISALWSMLQNSSLADAIVWHDDETVVLRHNVTLTERALPIFYGHNNIASFTRQLNVYGFTRLPVSQTRALLGTTTTPNSSTDTTQVSAWRHPKFNRRDPSRSSEIVPRLSKQKVARRQMRAAAAAAEGGYFAGVHTLQDAEAEEHDSDPDDPPAAVEP